MVQFYNAQSLVSKGLKVLFKNESGFENWVKSLAPNCSRNQTGTQIADEKVSILQQIMLLFSTKTEVVQFGLLIKRLRFPENFKHVLTINDKKLTES